MRSYARLSQFALVVVAGLLLANQQPFYSQSGMRPESPAGALPLGTVTVLNPMVNCLTGAATGANCEEIEVSNCPGPPGQPELPPLSATLAVAVPTAPLIGTIVLHAGGPGTSFLNSGFPDTYLADGFNVVQIAWSRDWASADGAGVKSAACRPATVFDYVFKVVQRSSRSIGFCGQGASGGGAALGYSLAHYGLSSELDYVVIAAGPSVSRMDYGCDPPLYNGPPRNLCPLLTDAPFAYSPGDASKVNTWEGTTTCGRPKPLRNEVGVWAGDSLVSSGANYDYPQTAMSWFFCVTQPNESTGQGSFLIDQVVPKNAPPDVNCYSGACQGEGVWQDPNAFNTTVSEMLTQCQANH